LRVNADKEVISKAKVADEIAKEYGIDSKVILTDDIKSPVDMIRKAAGLSKQQLEGKIEELEDEIKTLKAGEQQFDKGQRAITSEEDSLDERYPSMKKKKK